MKVSGPNPSDPRPFKIQRLEQRCWVCAEASYRYPEGSKTSRKWDERATKVADKCEALGYFVMGGGRYRHRPTVEIHAGTRIRAADGTWCTVVGEVLDKPGTYTVKWDDGSVTEDRIED